MDKHCIFISSIMW